jgi:hypothetical protein
MRAAVSAEDLTAVVAAETSDRSGQLVAALLTRWQLPSASSSASSSASASSDAGADSEPALTAELSGTDAATDGSADAAVMRRLSLTTADAMSHAVFVGCAQQIHDDFSFFV